MADGTGIEWTDATWNVITGCSIESPGCKNCYAMKLAGTRLKHHPSREGLTKPSAAGPVWTGEVRFNEQWLKQPLAWTRPRQIFVCAHSDLFHPDVPTEWQDKVFAVMALCRRHTFQVLTKRPGIMARYVVGLHTPAGVARIEAAARSMGYTFEFKGAAMLHFPLRNVWLGCSVEDQRYADQRRIHMEDLAARGRGWLTWVSYEPALGPVDWAGWEFLRWMVAGGEAVANGEARVCYPEWFQASRDYCARNGIAFLFKQWGDWHPRAQALAANVAQFHNVHERMANVGKKAAGRLLDGALHDGYPTTTEEPTA